MKKHYAEIRLSEQAKRILSHLREKHNFNMSDEEVLEWFSKRGVVIGDQTIYIEMICREALKGGKENGVGHDQDSG